MSSEDNEIIAEFVIESREHLSDIENQLLAIEAEIVRMVNMETETSPLWPPLCDRRFVKSGASNSQAHSISFCRTFASVRLVRDSFSKVHTRRRKSFASMGFRR